MYTSLEMDLSSLKSNKIRWFCYWRNSAISTTEINFLSTFLERFFTAGACWCGAASPWEIRYVVLFYILERIRANASDNWSALPLISPLVINIKCSDIYHLRCPGRFLVEVNFPHCKANFNSPADLLSVENRAWFNRRYLGSSPLRAKIKLKLQF